MSLVEKPHESIFSLGFKGEKTLNSLLISVFSIVKQLRTLQSDPVLVYSVVSPTTANPNSNTPVHSTDDLGSSSDESTSNQPLNINSKPYIQDNERIKSLNSECIQHLNTLKQIILDIQSSNKIEGNITENDEADETELKEQLEKLKLEAYQKNCIIKKLIDNMRLLQLTINTINRTSITD
ncbi:putative mediator complex subunit 30 [Tieghemostelium lacteum]|uniref:Putative mediator complex subunit 30 n=1 Tax=Tieghemostelium lacteum TaxID=361077 RepID=A0A151ZDR7_TIELA|nr:putative mediator complex subunit 30 [Tieghemostelium lacteum]|eukprot:KYQ92050.1 putative mediator complex subunit 30 [Tieghemostelium lacteum]